MYICRFLALEKSTYKFFHICIYANKKALWPTTSLLPLICSFQPSNYSEHKIREMVHRISKPPVLILSQSTTISYKHSLPASLCAFFRARFKKTLKVIQVFEYVQWRRWGWKFQEEIASALIVKSIWVASKKLWRGVKVRKNWHTGRCSTSDRNGSDDRINTGGGK